MTNFGKSVLGTLLGIALTTAMPLAIAYSEAPSLAAAVAARTLPPVGERLPQKPEIITPVKNIGTYGGVLRTALRGNADHNAILRMVGHQGLVRWNIDFTQQVPNVAESWTTNADASEYTFKLRRGMKWSDGQPFTADDILFYVQDLMVNKGYSAYPPDRFTVADKPMVAEKIDDYTVKLKFAGPYNSFIENLAHPTGQYPVLYAKHYCSQFHPKYNPKLDELLKAASIKDWGSLMRAKCGDVEIPARWGNPDRPTLDPWVISEPYGGGVTRVVVKRNPYFWQVDTRGQQLPYIDEIRFPVISEVETIVLSTINGQLDFQFRHIGIVQNVPVLSENAKRAGYRLVQLEDLSSNAAGLWPNQTTKNEKLRPLLRNRDFRVALSLAMNRNDINDVIFLGQTKPWQIGPKPSNRFYNEKLGTQYTKYDLKAANNLLDKIGLTRRDGDGFRQYPSGGRISINCIAQISSTNSVELLELLRKQWAEAGIELVINAVERSLFYDRSNANDYDMAIFVVGGGLDPTFDKTGVLSWSALESRQSLLWVKWAESNGKQGEEPSPNMKKRLELHDQWKLAKNSKEADELLRQILALAAEEFDVLGTVSTPKVPGIISKRLVNVSEHMPWGWPYATPADSLPQQYYFAK